MATARFSAGCVIMLATHIRVRGQAKGKQVSMWRRRKSYVGRRKRLTGIHAADSEAEECIFDLDVIDRDGNNEGEGGDETRYSDPVATLLTIIRNEAKSDDED
jgi:hypothetical protein